jgi:predicted HTH domain antitoxin
VETLRVEVELPRDLLSGLNLAEEDLGRQAKEWIVLELFREATISAGKAAEVLGIPLAGFLDLLDRRGLPYLDAAADEVAAEVTAARMATSALGA